MTDISSYRALDAGLRQIRVLTIVGITPVRGKFEYASLNDTPLFDAISWQWGDITTSATIEVDGAMISIPSNALCVLQELCISHSRLKIWLDAVCINQQDQIERSQQVAIMNEIYQAAQQTLVWLGTDNGSTEAAIATLDYLDAWRKIKHSKHNDCDMWCDRAIDSAFPLDVDWTSLVSLFSAGWFTRFWIIQEVAFSRDVLVIRGKHSIRWPLLAGVAHYIVLNAGSSQHLGGHSGVNNAIAIAKAREGHGFLDEQQQRFEATDPRDRAFALYGLLSLDAQNVKMREAFRPDYLKTLCEVYIDITKASIVHSSAGLTRILSAQRLVPRIGVLEAMEHFPSWVPRYDYVEDTSRGSYRIIYCDISMQRSLPPPEDDAPPHTLRVSGVVLGEVTEVLAPITALPSREVDSGVLSTLSALWARFNQLHPNTTEASLAAIVRDVLTAALPPTERRAEQFSAFVHEFWPEPKPLDILVASSDTDEDSDFDFGTDIEDELETMEQMIGEPPYEDVDDLSTSCSEFELPDEDEVATTDAMLFYRDMLHSCVNRPFIFDSKGNLGTAGRLARTGDQLCIVRGLPVPVLLRPSGPVFTFVSDIYLGTNMDAGALLDESETSRILVQDRLDICRTLERTFDLV